MGKKKKITILVVVLAVLVVAIGGLFGYMCYENSQTYDEAMVMIESGNYVDAQAKLETLGSFSDSEDYAEQIETYYLALVKARDGLIDEAYEHVDNIDLLPNRTDLLTYISALECIERGDYEFAYEKFMSVVNFEDSSDYAHYVDIYMKGIECLNEKDYESAKRNFDSIIDFCDSKEILDSIYDYNEAVGCLQEGDLDRAKTLLAGLNSHINASELLDKITSYQTATEYMTVLNYKKALDIFTELGDMLDSAEKAEKLTFYCQAMEAFDNEDYASAYTLFEAADGIIDSETLKKDSMFNAGISLIIKGKARQAGTYFLDLVLDNRYLSEKFGTPYDNIDEDMNDGTGHMYRKKWAELATQYWDEYGAVVSLFYYSKDDTDPAGFCIRYEDPNGRCTGFYAYDMDGSYNGDDTWIIN